MTDDSTKHPAAVLAARIWDVLQQPNHSTTEKEIEQILRGGMAELGLAQVGMDLAEAGSDRSVYYPWNGYPRPMTVKEKRSAEYFYLKRRFGVADADPYPPERRGKLQDVFDDVHVQTARLICFGINAGEICNRGGCIGLMFRNSDGHCQCSECGSQA